MKTPHPLFKKAFKTLSLTAILFLLFFNVQCKKEHSMVPVNITLYDKPLSVIQSNIQGKWKLQYEKGGICATCVTNFNNNEYIWQFSPIDKVKKTYNNTLLADTTIKWIKDLDTYANGASTYIMNFYDKRLYPSSYIVDGIFNDTLKLHDAYTVDAVFYHFTKTN